MWMPHGLKGVNLSLKRTNGTIFEHLDSHRATVARVASSVYARESTGVADGCLDHESVDVYTLSHFGGVRLRDL
jgi:hypothetical protein